MSEELVDYEIAHLAIHDKMVVPFELSLLQPNTLDVRLSWDILYELEPDEVWAYEYKVNHSPPGHFEMYTEIVRTPLTTFVRVDLRKAHTFLFSPGDFVLGSTIEQFNLPHDVRAQFHLKSSRAREGYGHSLAGFCDPGWFNSNLTLELINSSKATQLPLYEGLVIGQMAFTRLDKAPQVGYNDIGHYNRDKGTQPSKMSENAKHDFRQ